MLAAMAGYRTIRDADSYTECCARLALTVERLDEILDGLTWAIATKPEHFWTIADGSSIRVATTEESDSTPALRLFYRIVDVSLCERLWIEERDVPEAEDRSG
jgi:hypothetical protein